MRVSERNSDGVLVLELEGRIDSNTAQDFEDNVFAAIGRGEHALVLNFEQLEYISSAGLRVLLKTARDLKTRDGHLVLCCIRDYIQEVLDLAGFTTILAVAPDEPGALKMISGS
jgi:anti-sigma B factor antagonist